MITEKKAMEEEQTTVVDDATQAQSIASSPVQRKLTKKQREFIKEYKANPLESTTSIVKRIYDVKNDKVASVIGTENLSKPSIVSHLSKYSDDIEDTIGTVAKELVQSDKIENKKEGLLNMRWIHDKVHGKATQRTEVTTQGITITVDLSSSL